MSDTKPNPESKRHDTLTIQRPSRGGYLVFPFASIYDNREPVFACTTLDEVFEFVRGALIE